MDISKFNRSHFTLIAPAPKESEQYAASVFADHTLRLNGRLNQAMGDLQEKRYVRIFYWAEENQLLVEAVEQQTEGAMRLPKSGVVSVENLTACMAEKKIPMPAYFRMYKLPDENAWVGEYVRNHKFPVPRKPEKLLRRPRKQGLEQMLPDGSAL